MHIKFDYNKGYLSSKIFHYQEVVDAAHESLHAKTGKGNDYLGWLDWPVNYDKSEFNNILNFFSICVKLPKPNLISRL